MCLECCTVSIDIEGAATIEDNFRCFVFGTLLQDDAFFVVADVNEVSAYQHYIQVGDGRLDAGGSCRSDFSIHERQRACLRVEEDGAVAQHILLVEAGHLCAFDVEVVAVHLLDCYPRCYDGIAAAYADGEFAQDERSACRLSYLELVVQVKT